MSLADPQSPWQRACMVAQLLQADKRLQGVVIKARAGAVRDAYLQLLEPDLHRIHASISSEALLGGIDLSATLAANKVVQTTGLLKPGAKLIVAMAERIPPQTAAILAQALDADPTLRLVLLDEGVEDEGVASCLIERLPFWVNLDDVPYSDLGVDTFGASKGRAKHSDQDLMTITSIADSFGVRGARAPQFTLHVAQAIAGLGKRKTISDKDIATAAGLVFAHKATRLPEAEADQEPEAQSEPLSEDRNDEESSLDSIPEELVLEAVLASLPPDVLAKLSGKGKGNKGSGSGAKTKGNRRGRPLPSRAARPSSDRRIDLYATLRAAAPWQTIRRQETGRVGLQIRASDLRVKRFEERSDRLIIFAVDASGSSAISRLAEAKGAIELLLSDAYARRDHVALVSFRGTAAETLLNPTRSLVQTKRRLAELPGGGGTPLASGMEVSLELALTAQRRGMTPSVCILTDGRANIDRSGQANRIQAMEDASAMARNFLSLGIDALVIDTGVRPERKLKELADTMHAPYIPMPRADAKRLSEAIGAAV